MTVQQKLATENRAAVTCSSRYHQVIPAWLRYWVALIAVAVLCAPFGVVPVFAADPVSGQINLIDPTPVGEQQPAFDGFNLRLSALTGVVGGYSNHMFLASLATPAPFASGFGAQLDLGIGKYRHDYISAAAGLHLFWRDPGRGMIGIYGDWGYVNPEHSGRVGVEGAIYNDRWTLDGFAGVQFGQHVMTEFVDEVDLSYYFTDDLRGSFGHRLTSRGHAANVGFEFRPAQFNGWTVFGEAEAGEDDYYGAWAGLRFSLGAAAGASLIEQDRGSGLRIRIPRNIASVTQCGDIPNPANYFKSWNGFEHHMSDHLCADEAELDSRGAIIGKM